MESGKISMFQQTILNTYIRISILKYLSATWSLLIFYSIFFSSRVHQQHFIIDFLGFYKNTKKLCQSSFFSSPIDRRLKKWFCYSNECSSAIIGEKKELLRMPIERYLFNSQDYIYITRQKKVSKEEKKGEKNNKNVFLE